MPDTSGSLTDQPAAGAPAGPGLRLARLVTEITAPAVLVALLLLVVGWRSTPPGGNGLVWGLIATLFASVVPFGYVLRGVRRGRLTDHHVRVREQRPLPLLFGLGSTVVGLVLLSYLDAPRPVRALVAAGAVGLLVSATVSRWWKMSIHMAVAGGSAVVLVLIDGPVMFLLWPLLGLVGWARVRLRDHTVGQVVVGAVVGGLVAGLVFGVLNGVP